MSVQTEITRIQSAKRAISEAIGAKGVTVPPTAKLDDLAALTEAIPGPKPEQEKTITITENGDFPITPDVGKVLSKVLAKVNVPTGGGGGGLDPTPLSKIDIMSWTFGASVGYLDIPQEKMPGLVLFLMFNLSMYPAGSKGFDIGISSADSAYAPGWRAFDTFRCDPNASTMLVHVKAEPYGLNMATGRVTFSFKYDVYPASGDTYVGVLFYK